MENREDIIKEIAEEAKDILLAEEDGAFVVSYVVRRVITKNTLTPDRRAAILYAASLQQEADYNQGATVLRHDIDEIIADEFDSIDEGINYVLSTTPEITAVPKK